MKIRKLVRCKFQNIVWIHHEYRQKNEAEISRGDTLQKEQGLGAGYF
jgi:hypothetical protein